MFDKAKDPVCGMKISKKTAAAVSKYMDRTFYFCSEACKKKFYQDSMKHMKVQEKKSSCCG